MIRQPPPPREAAAAPAAPPDDPASAEASGIMAQHGMPAPSTIPTPPEGPRQQPGAAAAAVQPAHGCQLAMPGSTHGAGGERLGSQGCSAPPALASAAPGSAHQAGSAKAAGAEGGAAAAARACRLAGLTVVQLRTRWAQPLPVPALVWSSRGQRRTSLRQHVVSNQALRVSSQHNMLCDLSFCACVARPALSPLTSCANNRSEAAHGRRLRNAGQPTSGTKAELLRRLKSGSAPAAATGHPPGAATPATAPAAAADAVACSASEASDSDGGGAARHGQLRAPAAAARGDRGGRGGAPRPKAATKRQNFVRMSSKARLPVLHGPSLSRPQGRRHSFYPCQSWLSSVQCMCASQCVQPACASRLHAADVAARVAAAWQGRRGPLPEQGSHVQQIPAGAQPGPLPQASLSAARVTLSRSPPGSATVLNARTSHMHQTPRFESVAISNPAAPVWRSVWRGTQRHGRHTHRSCAGAESVRATTLATAGAARMSAMPAARKGTGRGTAQPDSACRTAQR